MLPEEPGVLVFGKKKSQFETLHNLTKTKAAKLQNYKDFLGKITETTVYLFGTLYL